MGSLVRLDTRTPWNLCYLSPTGCWCLLSLGFFPVIPVVIYLTCLFPNKLHCQAAIIQTFVLVILPEIFTDLSSGKARDKNDDRWKIHLLEIAIWGFFVSWGFF